MSARRIRPSIPSAGERGQADEGDFRRRVRDRRTTKGTRRQFALRRLPRGPIIGVRLPVTVVGSGAAGEAETSRRRRSGPARSSLQQGPGRKPLADEADPAYPGHGTAPHRADQADRRLVHGSRARLPEPASPIPDGFRPGQKRDAVGGGGRMAAARRANARRMGE